MAKTERRLATTSTQVPLRLLVQIHQERFLSFYRLCDRLVRTHDIAYVQNLLARQEDSLFRLPSIDEGIAG